MKSFQEYLTERKTVRMIFSFKRLLAKYGVDSPEDLDDTEKKNSLIMWTQTGNQIKRKINNAH